jgi:phosphomevalonate kinase
VHQQVQGSGSGIDVAAAAHGGVFRWAHGRATPVEAPTIHLAYSGSSAATHPRVVAFRAWAAAHPNAASAFVADTVALVDAFADDPVAVLNGAGQRLGAMSEAAGIAYWTPGLQALCALARQHGGGAKPSGAGGGDVVVATFPNAASAEGWRADAAAQGYPVLAVAIAPGAREVIPPEGGPPAA